VAGAGVLGPRPDPSPEAAVLVSPAPPASPAAVEQDPSANTSPDDPAAPVVFPASFDAIPALAPSAVIEQRRAGTLGDVVAVAGYLGIATPAPTCIDAPEGPMGPWCKRYGVIADAAWTDRGTDGFSGIPAHLHVTVPVGVRLPPDLVRMATSAGGGPVAVVALGRFAYGPACPGAAGTCEDGFIVDRITWADGVDVGLTPLIEEALQTWDSRGNPFQQALNPTQIPLLAVLAWPRTLREVDPAAVPAASKGPENQPVWYIRVVDTQAPAPANHRENLAVRWMLVDEARFTILAVGRPDAGIQWAVPQANG
jgi:hypothetical protein